MYPAPDMQTAAEYISQGRQARHENRLSDARAHYAEAAHIYRDQKNPLAYAHTIRHIADMHLDESDLAAAKPLYEESLEIYRGNLETKLLDLANTVRPYALLNEKLGELETARQLWQEARNLYASLRIEPGVAECEKHLAKLIQA
jgi:tetratricopeptide (TPR) repeat protein